MVYLGLDWIRYQFLAFYPVKGIHQILSPCVLGKMELEGLVLEIRALLNRKRPHLILTNHSKSPTFVMLSSLYLVYFSTVFCSGLFAVLILHHVPMFILQSDI